MSNHMQHLPGRPESEHRPDNGSEPRRRGFWTSTTGLLTIAFLAIAAFFLVSEHRAHALGFLPWLLLLACPLLHVFGHGGHGGPHGHSSDGDRGSNGDRAQPHQHRNIE
ncbi:DUF2933 domain-containing protein [Mesorhizobium sp. VK24D]|uniref:DUF2933 domain-containing protein n=1 Tax=Mesorhizobium album TaxID=3072314 RepID=A0ABU4XTA8_9HYPH|nr:DUF2933 domain-containing protein [Mesorhizobium sp. VK24D]MDX8477945.1 DUF2933 domain-containing protein [Mesorhizobium sp. VK24D]